MSLISRSVSSKRSGAEPGEELLEFDLGVRVRGWKVVLCVWQRVRLVTHSRVDVEFS